MRRKVGLFLVFGAVLPLAVASVAWACGVLATVTLDKKVASPGETVTATGKNWGTAAGVSGVSIRLQTRTGTVLANTPALTGGRINETFALPNSLSPGWYVVVATQTNANGTPKSGTPGRTTLRIQGVASSKSSEAAPTAWGPASSGPPASSGGSGSPSLLAILLAASLSLTMLAGGWTLLSRRGRTSGAPQFGI
jgi:hypothetical protein